MEEHREYSATGLKARNPLQTPSSVGFQAASEDDVTTQTKPLGCHQPDIGIVIPIQNGSWGKLYRAAPKRILTSSLVRVQANGVLIIRV